MSAAKLFDSVNAEKLRDDTGMAMAYAEYYLGVAAEICLRNEMSRCFEFTRRYGALLNIKKIRTY